MMLRFLLIILTCCDRPQSDISNLNGFKKTLPNPCENRGSQSEDQVTEPIEEFDFELKRLTDNSSSWTQGRYNNCGGVAIANRISMCHPNLKNEVDPRYVYTAFGKKPDTDWTRPGYLLQLYENINKIEGIKKKSKLIRVSKKDKPLEFLKNIVFKNVSSVENKNSCSINRIRHSGSSVRVSLPFVLMTPYTGWYDKKPDDKYSQECIDYYNSRNYEELHWATIIDIIENGKQCDVFLNQFGRQYKLNCDVFLKHWSLELATGTANIAKWHPEVNPYTIIYEKHPDK